MMKLQSFWRQSAISAALPIFLGLSGCSSLLFGSGDECESQYFKEVVGIPDEYLDKRPGYSSKGLSEEEIIAKVGRQPDQIITAGKEGKALQWDYDYVNPLCERVKGFTYVFISPSGRAAHATVSDGEIQKLTPTEAAQLTGGKK